MSKKPVTYDDVAITAATMVSEGVEPSVRLVQQKLQRGSYSTIGPHLSTWRTVEGGEELPPALVTLVRHAHKVFVESAEQSVAEDRSVLEQQREHWEAKFSEMESELSEAKHAINSQADQIKIFLDIKSRLERDLEDRKSVLRKNKRTHDELHEEINELNAALSQQKQAVAVEEERSTALVSQRDEARNALQTLREHSETTEKSLRDKNGELQEELRAAQVAGARAKEEAEQLRYKTSEYKAEIELAKKERVQLTKSRDSSMKKLSDLELKLAKEIQERTHLQDVIDRQSREIEKTESLHVAATQSQQRLIDSLTTTIEKKEGPKK